MGYKRKETKAKINWGWNSPEDRNGKATRSTKKSNKNINKTIKKIGFKGLLISLVVLLFCLALGIGASYFLTRNDCFELKGDKDIVLSVETPYVEDGYTVIEFSKDISKKVTIETNMKVDINGNYIPQYDELGNPIIGEYYIIYKVNSFKYSKFSTIEKIRLITFEDITEN